MKKNTGDIKVVMLCGGVGKRMFPLETDKSLLEFNGIPLIVHQVNAAKSAGLKDFIIVTNKNNMPLIRDAVSGIKGINAAFVNQVKAAGMADALLTASPLIKTAPFILVSSNDIFDISAYRSLLKAYAANPVYVAYLTAYRVKDYFPGGYLKVNSKGEVKHIVEKPPRGKEPSDLVNIVLHLHTAPQRLFKLLETTKSTSDDVYEKTLAKIASAAGVKAVPYSGKWQSIKYPWHILDAMDYFASVAGPYISKKAIVSDRAVITGAVYIADGARVFEGAVIRGPSYVGPKAVIGNNVLIRNSSIGAGTVIGFNTEIKHSYIGSNCWFHSNYAGDSVIEPECAFGAGTITANFRLDEGNVHMLVGKNKVDSGHDKLGVIIGRGTKVGVNTSIMPGIRIGSNSFISPHICLNHDVDSNSIVLQQQGNLIVRPNRRQANPSHREKLLEKLIS